MLTNNDIMKKLRIALSLRDTDIIAILKLADFEISASELSALFRKEGHPLYKQCGDQILRRFLDGLIIRNRGARPGNLPAPALGSTAEEKGSARGYRPLKKGPPPRAPKPDRIRVYRAETETQ